MTTADVENIVRDAFADVALLIASMVAAHHVDDDLVWSLLRRLDRLRVQTLAQLARRTKPADRYAGKNPERVHPAVEAFLARNQQS